MRFKTKNSNIELGSKKIKIRYLLFPKRIGDEIRWLEVAKIEYTYCEMCTFDDGIAIPYRIWEATKWLPYDPVKDCKIYKTTGCVHVDGMLCDIEECNKKINKKIKIAIDFDGTCVAHEFPKVGKNIGAIPVLKKLIEAGHQLILFTMRSDIENPKSTNYNTNPIGGKYLTEAVNWFKKNNIPLYGINFNPTQKNWTKSPKAYAELYIDDAALGCPLIHPKEGKPYVDWITIENMLVCRNLL